MTREPRPLFLFGEFRLDVANHSIERAGSPIEVPPKAFQLLVHLVRNTGSLVTKEELLDVLWPDVVVQENNLTQQVSLLRKLLGAGEWIETVPRVGYRFVAELRHSSETPAPGRPGGRQIAAIAAICAVLAAIVVATIVRNGSDASRSPIRSLAVLPLRPIDPSGGADHLGMGIADAIIVHLAAQDAIAVRPTSAVRKYAATTADAKRAAEELGVDAVLEGTIERSSARIRVRVQLVDARKNVPVFSGKFDEPASDLFAVEDAVGFAVARALSLEGATAGKDQAAKRHSHVPGAYEAYLKGRFEWSKRSPDGLRQSILHYEEAINRDPSYAAAYAALSESLNSLSMHRILLPVESFPRAKEAAAKALTIDETVADAHVALGMAAFYYDWDWLAAEAHLRRAIQLDPQTGSARQFLANLQVATGRPNEAVQTMAEALRRDPMSIPLMSVAGHQFYLARRYEDGIRQARKALDRDSSFVQAHIVLARNLILSGRIEEGIASAERFAELIGSDSYAVADLAQAYACHAARKDEARAMLPRLLDLLKRGKVSPYDMARYDAALGDRRETLRYLEQTMALRDPGMVWIAAEPLFDFLRDDPRFQGMLRTMKLASPIQNLKSKI